MQHQMGLYKEYFKAIKEGRKTVEVRLNDENRRRIKVGDTIEFISVPEQNETLKVQVLELKNMILLKICIKIFRFTVLIVKVGQWKKC